MHNVSNKILNPKDAVELKMEDDWSVQTKEINAH